MKNKVEVKVSVIVFFILIVLSLPGFCSGPIIYWDTVPNAKGYKIYYGETVGIYPNAIDVANTNQYSLSNLSLTEGIDYYFVVRAYNDTQESGNSDYVNFNISVGPDFTPLPNVQGVGAFVSENNVQLNWGEVNDSNLSGYMVYYGTSSRVYNSPIFVNDKTDYTFVGLDNNTTYYFCVTAVDIANNESGFSAEISRTIDIPNSPDFGGIGVLEDDFSVDTLANYTILSGGFSIEGGKAHGGNWETSRVYHNTSLSSTDHWVAADIEHSGILRDTVGLLLRVDKNEQRGYEFYISASSSSVRLDSFQNETRNTLVEKNINYNAGTYHVKMEAYGDVIKIYINEELIIEHKDNTYDSGNNIGLRFFRGKKNIDVKADNFKGGVLGTIDATPPSVSINSPTADPSFDISSAKFDISGIASDDNGVIQVAWSNSRGGSGTATGTTSWSVAGIFLAEGKNVITVAARDAAGNMSTDVLTVMSTIPDTIAPLVTISEPTVKAIFNSSQASINILGTASDNIGVTQIEWWSSVGAGGIATGTSDWSVDTIYLIEGENVITITAIDEAGNKSTDVLTAVYTIPDTTAPTVTITAPTTGTSYNTASASLNIGGTSSDAIGVTKVAWANSRGGSGTATGTTSWSAAGLALAEGSNVITVTARDAAGNTSTDILTVVYTIPDTTAPVVTFTAPTTGTSYNTASASLNIGGTASDAIGVTQVAWSNSRGRSGTATGTTSWSAAGLTLAEGNNVITVTARDAAGNTSTDILTVVYTIPDTTAPVVTFTAPTTGTSYATQSASLNIGGTASDAIGVTKIAWTNSRGGSGTATGTTSWSAAGLTLAEGSNVITVTVSDAAGNTSTDILTVVYTIPDTTAPVVTFTAPTTGTSYATTSASLNIGGTSSDAIGVTQVSWTNSRGGSGTATGTTNWSAAGLTLTEGNNVITVTARDAAGNSSTDVLTVVYTIPVVVDTQAPVLRVNKPTTGGFYFTRQANVTISGTSSDNTGVKEIRWSISQGGSGVASGTSNWEAVSVPLAKRWNNITITAEDEAGNKTTSNFTVYSWR